MCPHFYLHVPEILQPFPQVLRYFEKVCGSVTTTPTTISFDFDDRMVRVLERSGAAIFFALYTISCSLQSCPFFHRSVAPFFHARTCSVALKVSNWNADSKKWDIAKGTFDVWVLSSAMPSGNQGLHATFNSN